MKKSIQVCAFLLFIILSSGSSAQSYVGVFGGLNSSKLNGDAPDKAKYKSLMGVNAGAYFDLKLSKNIWLSLQPSYSQEGTKISYNVSGKEVPVDSIRIRLNYFSLPLFLKISSTNERWYALAGIETAMLLNSSVYSHDIEQDVDLSVVEWNLAMHFGAGIRIPVGFPRLIVELRYSQGLVNLTDESIDASYVPRVKTSGYKLLVGIEIPLNKSKK
ncbi:MAG: porin family protein [Bacteroidota bacterium]|nr:porin family protein [Bacteroidota bacterium]